MENFIYVEFLGVVRLLVGRKEDTFQFGENATLNWLMEELTEKYGEEVKKECLNQIIVLQLPGAVNPRQLKWPKDQNVPLLKNSLVRFVSMVTGG